MSKEQTYISEGQANWRTLKAVSGMIVCMAIGAIPAWHFSAEHTRLAQYEAQQSIKTADAETTHMVNARLSELQPLPESTRTILDSVKIAAKGK